MMNSRSMNLWAVCWLGLALLVLFPGGASAQRRGRSQEEYEDPICYKPSYDGVCQKFRVALVGAGILSGDGASSGVGMKLGYSLVASRLEVGGSLLFVKDLRFQEGPYLGTAEGLLRFATVAGPNHRFFLELAAGASRYDSPEKAYWAFPCASGGASLELSAPGLGVFVTAGLTLMWAEGMAALPHAGVGLVF